MKKLRSMVIGVGFCVVAISSAITPVAHAATSPTVTWKVSSLIAKKSYNTSSIATTNSSGSKVWSVSGSCTLISGKVTALESGACTVTLRVKAKGKFSSKTASKKLSIKSANASTPSGLETVAQANARKSASTYLSISAFSRLGLIDQLVYEKFSVADATYAVDAVGADWNVQAGKSAIQYLKLSSFSRQGLIDQLLYEKFTQAEAEYGATKAGL